MLALRASRFTALLLLAPAVAEADVASPDLRRIDTEYVFTGTEEFPSVRFVLAVMAPPKEDRPESVALPGPSPVREGEPMRAAHPYFQRLRAIARDAPEPVTDQALDAAHAPSSGHVGIHPRQVPLASSAKTTRLYYQIRQIRADWISAEMLAVTTLLADGTEQASDKVVPVDVVVSVFDAPPGWQLFMMADPNWPSADPPLPATPCARGAPLPLLPGPRTLVAVEGPVGADGSLSGKRFVSWGPRLDDWMRESVPADSSAVSQRMELELKVTGEQLAVSGSDLYEDRFGRLYWDSDGRSYLARRPRWWWGTGIGLGTLVLAGGTGWMLRLRRRHRSGQRATEKGSAGGS